MNIPQVNLPQVELSAASQYHLDRLYAVSLNGPGVPVEVAGDVSLDMYLSITEPTLCEGMLLLNFTRRTVLNVDQSHSSTCNEDEHSTESETSSTQGATTFTCFKKLPLELQSRVWYFYIHGDPHIVSFSSDDNDLQDIYPIQVPTIFKINKSIRENAIKHLNYFCFYNSPSSHPHTAHQYLQTETDVLFITSYSTGSWSTWLSTFSYCPQKLTKNVRSIAITIPPNHDPTLLAMAIAALKLFTNLELVLLVARPQEATLNSVELYSGRSQFQLIDRHEIVGMAICLRSSGGRDFRRRLEEALAWEQNGVRVKPKVLFVSIVSSS